MKVKRVITNKGEFYVDQMDETLIKLLEMNDMIYQEIEEVERIHIKYTLKQNHIIHIRSVYVETFQEMRDFIENLLKFIDIKKIEIEF